MRNPPMTPADFTDEQRKQPALVQMPADFFNGVFTEPYRFIRIAYRNSNNENNVGIPALDPTYETFQAVQIHDVELIENFREPQVELVLGSYTLFSESVTKAFLGWDVRGENTPQAVDSNLTDSVYYYDFIVARKDAADVRWADILWADVDIDGTGLMKITPATIMGGVTFHDIIPRDEISVIDEDTGGDAFFKILAGAITTELNFDGTIYQGGTSDDQDRRNSVVGTYPNQMYVAPVNPDGSTPPPPTPTDNMPSFGGESITDIAATMGTAIDAVTLPAATGGDAPLTYSLSPNLPNGLTFNANTRELSGNPTALLRQTTFTYTVTDADGDTDTLRFSITVVAADAAPAPMCSVGFTYNSRTGLCEDDDGFGLTETPTCPEGWRWNSITSACERIPTPPVDLMPMFADGAMIADISATVGTAIQSVTLPAATGGDAPLTYSLDTQLPDGLTFNANTRVLAGNPTAALRQTTYTYTVTDTDGDTDTLTFQLTVTSPADAMPTFIGGNARVTTNVRVGDSVNITLPLAIGGDGELTYQLLLLNLATGLSFDENTRVLSGTVRFTRSIRLVWVVSDADGDESQKDYVFRV